jgi:phage protein D
MATYPQYAPEFRIRIGGENAPAALRASLASLSYQDGLEGADRVEITVANENLRWLDHPLLQVDVPLSLSIGYAPGPLEEVFVGEITGVEPSFPSGGMPTLRLVAHDFLQRLTTGTKDRAFALSLPCIGKFPLPDPAVVALVAGTNLMIPALDPVGSALSFLTLLAQYAIDPLEAKRGIRFQQGQSDFDFLSQIARDNGWEMYVDHTVEPRGRVLRFQFLVQDYAPSVSLRWGESLTEFTPRLSTVGQVAAVSARIWVASLKTEVVIVLGWDFDRAAFDLAVYPGLGSLEELQGGQAQSILKVEAGGPALAPKKILSELLPRLNNRLTGSGSTIGNPAIKAGAVIDLGGLGEQFSGLYRITSANHTIDGGGYRTSFEVRKEVWFGSIPVPKGPEGLLRVQGQTIQ